MCNAMRNESKHDVERQALTKRRDPVVEGGMICDQQYLQAGEQAVRDRKVGQAYVSDR